MIHKVSAGVLFVLALIAWVGLGVAPTAALAARVLFVDPDANPGGNGTFKKPLTSLAEVALISKPGNVIFLFAGAHQGPLTLQENQTVIGESEGFVRGNKTVVAPGARPTISSPNGHGIILAPNVSIRGANVGDTPNGYGVFGDSVSGVTIRNVTISGRGGAVRLSSNTGADVIDVMLDAVSSDQANENGILLENVSGGFSVSGDTTIQAATNNGIWVLNNGATIAFANVDVNGSGTSGILVEDSSGSMEFGATTVVNSSGSTSAAVEAREIESGMSSADFTFASLSIDGQGSASDGLLLDTTGTLQINVSGGPSGLGGFIEGTSSRAIALFNVSDSTIRSVDIDQGDIGVLYNDVTGAHYLEGCSITDFATDAVRIEFTTGNAANPFEELRVNNCTIDADSSGMALMPGTTGVFMSPFDQSASDSTTSGTLVVEESNFLDLAVGIDLQDMGNPNDIDFQVAVRDTTMTNVGNSVMSDLWGDAGGTVATEARVTIQALDHDLDAIGSGLDLQVSGDSTLEALIVDSNFAANVAPARGLDFTARDQASFDITSRGNTLTELDGIFLLGAEDAAGDFRSLNDIINNTGTIGSGLATMRADFGSFVPTTASSEANVLVTEGTFTGSAGPEADFDLDGAGTMNVTLTNTFMSNDTLLDFDGLAALRSPAATICTNFMGNTVNPSGFDFQLDNHAGGTFDVVDLGSLSANNGGALFSFLPTIGSFNDTGPTPCPLPDGVVVPNSIVSEATDVTTGFTDLSVVVLKDDGTPALGGTEVTFTAPASGASGFFSNGMTSIIEYTDFSGEATVSFTANATPGAYQVTASSTTLSGMATPMVFYLANRAH